MAAVFAMSFSAGYYPGDYLLFTNSLISVSCEVTSLGENVEMKGSGLMLGMGVFF